MVASARIDELRSKFDENPRRFFAPLANEYRKAGDLSTAIAICRTQLRQFPTHMSGHVVLGQALYEAGELTEARSVFERAVELDPENLIALRHLGDIGRATGDTDAARSWYRRVLDADPYNEPIAALVAELSDVRPAVPAYDIGEPIPEPTPEPALDVHAADAADAADDAVAPDAEAEAEAFPTEFVDLSADDFQWAPPTPVDRATAEVEAEPEPRTDTSGFEFLDEWSPESAESPTAFDPVVGLDLAPLDDVAVESLQHAELEAPDEAPTEAPNEVPDERPVEATAEPLVEPVVEAPVEAPVAAVEPPAQPWTEEEVTLDLVTSSTFATETMAELCLEQGHEQEALQIFEQLLAQRPGDAALASRVDALRSRLDAAASDAPTAGDFLRDLADRRPDPSLEVTAESPATPLELAAIETSLAVTEETHVPEPVGTEVGTGSGDGFANPSPEPVPDVPVVADAAPADETVVEPRDAWAANAWRSAFRPDAAPTLGVLAELATRVAEPAPLDLSFDRFFAGLEPESAETTDLPETPELTTIEVAEIPAPIPQEAPVAAVEPASAPVSTPAAAAPVSDEEDLADFNAWLRGLRDS